MNTSLIITSLISIAGSSAITLLIQAWFNRRKTAAEAGKTEKEGDAVILASYTKAMQELLDQGRKIHEENRQIHMENREIQSKYGETLVQVAQLKAEREGHLQTIKELRESQARTEKMTQGLKAEVVSMLDKLDEMRPRLTTIERILAESLPPAPATA